MLRGLYLSTAGAMVESQRQDVLANNLANVGSAGFRRQLAVVSARKNPQATQGAQNPLADLTGGLHVSATPTDSRGQSAIRQTGRNLDVAIRGDGYLKAQHGRQTVLSRNGSLAMDERGRLTLADGSLVLGIEGKPITLDPNEPIRIARDGGVFQAGNSVGQLSLVAPKDPSVLARLGAGMLEANGRERPANGSIEQGALEGSDVEPVREMVDLISASRGFDMNVQMIQLQSDGLATMLRQLPRLQ